MYWHYIIFKLAHNIVNNYLVWIYFRILLSIILDSEWNVKMYTGINGTYIFFYLFILCLRDFVQKDCSIYRIIDHGDTYLKQCEYTDFDDFTRPEVGL